MARTKLHVPDQFRFSTKLLIRVTDLNYGGHLANDSVARFLHETRYQFFKKLGYKDELSIEGIGAIQADLVIQYRSEAFQGEELEVQVTVTDTTQFSFDFVYLLTETSTNREIARAKTTMVTYDYDEKKRVPIPTALLDKLV